MDLPRTHEDCSTFSGIVPVVRCRCEIRIKSFRLCYGCVHTREKLDAYVKRVTTQNVVIMI